MQSENRSTRRRPGFDALEDKVVLSHFTPHTSGHHHHHHHNPSPVPTPPPVIEPPPIVAPPVAVSGQTISAKLTFYGWPDNSPPGNAIAYPTTTRPVAGGTGTYADPISAAVPEGSPTMPPGTILYLPTLQKYAVVDDICATCTGNWVDVWIGGTASDNPSAVIAKENALTPDQNVQIVVNAPDGLTVDTTPLF